jgi:hypothetical protein
MQVYCRKSHKVLIRNLRQYNSEIAVGEQQQEKVTFCMKIDH